jgi:UDP-N-acetylmuramate dehydrogenase
MTVKSEWIERLPKVRGHLTPDAPIGPTTWFRVGGPAELLFRPADMDDLAEFLAALPADIPVTVIGAGSNLLVRDGGIPGVTVRLALAPGFSAIEAREDEVTAGTGALDLKVAATAAQAGIAGLEFLSGIPGTVGGGFATNAGAYGREFKDVLISAEAVDRAGRLHRVGAAELGLSYRHSAAPVDWIFTAARFRGTPGDRAGIARRLAEIQAAREASQPIRARTGGSTFANPAGHQAWRLIDAAGCRGLARGGAMVSEKHANFLINTGNATAADIEGLGEEIRRLVYERFGVLLDWEIRRIGRRSSVDGILERDGDAPLPLSLPLSGQPPVTPARRGTSPPGTNPGAAA